MVITIQFPLRTTMVYLWALLCLQQQRVRILGHHYMEHVCARQQPMLTAVSAASTAITASNLSATTESYVGRILEPRRGQALRPYVKVHFMLLYITPQ